MVYRFLFLWVLIIIPSELLALCVSNLRQIYDNNTVVEHNLQDFTILSNNKKRDTFFLELFDALKNSDNDVIIRSVKFLKNAINLGYQKIIPPVILVLDSDIDIFQMDVGFFKDEKWNQLFVNKLEKSRDVNRITQILEFIRNPSHLLDKIPLSLIVASNITLQIQDFIRYRTVAWKDLYYELESGIIRRMQINPFESIESRDDRISEVLKNLALFADKSVISIYFMLSSRDPFDIDDAYYIISKIGIDTFHAFIRAYLNQSMDNFNIATSLKLALFFKK